MAADAWTLPRATGVTVRQGSLETSARTVPVSRGADTSAKTDGIYSLLARFTRSFLTAVVHWFLSLDDRIRLNSDTVWFCNTQVSQQMTSYTVPH